MHSPKKTQQNDSLGDQERVHGAPIQFIHERKRSHPIVRRVNTSIANNGLPSVLQHTARPSNFLTGTQQSDAQCWDIFCRCSHRSGEWVGRGQRTRSVSRLTCLFRKFTHSGRKRSVKSCKKKVVKRAVKVNRLKLQNRTQVKNMLDKGPELIYSTGVSLQSDKSVVSWIPQRSSRRCRHKRHRRNLY